MISRKRTAIRLAAASLLGLVCAAHAAPPSTNPGVGNPNPPGQANRPPQAAKPIPPGLSNPTQGFDVPGLELPVGNPAPGPAQFEADPPFESAQSLATNSIPEPTSVALTTLGLIGVGLWRKRGRRAA
jgi:hypothetical protein